MEIKQVFYTQGPPYIQGVEVEEQAQLVLWEQLGQLGNRGQLVHKDRKDLQGQLVQRDQLGKRGLLGNRGQLGKRGLLGNRGQLGNRGLLE